eukprot:591955-Pyramimonas_sp.AAC.1
MRKSKLTRGLDAAIKPLIEDLSPLGPDPGRRRRLGLDTDIQHVFTVDSTAAGSSSRGGDALEAGCGARVSSSRSSGRLDCWGPGLQEEAIHWKQVAARMSLDSQQCVQLVRMREEVIEELKTLGLRSSLISHLQVLMLKRRRRARSLASHRHN